MKIAILCLAVCIAYVAGESCSNASDCDFEHCTGNGWSLACTGGTCTCSHSTHTGSACSHASDCSGNCPSNYLHMGCVDNECHCRFGPFTGGR